VIDGNDATPVVTNTLSHSGTYSAFAGDAPDGFCGRAAEAHGDSSFYQQFVVPADGGTLSFWYWTCTTDTIAFDWQDAYITDSNGFILQTIFHQCTNNNAWVQQTVDMAQYAGQTVGIKFLVHEDGFGDLTGMYVDDVFLPGQPATPTPTPTASPTPTPTPTASPTPTPTPVPCTDDIWTLTSMTNTPAARQQHTAVWTGSEMIVWGGYAGGVNGLNTGGRYNPTTDSWMATSTIAPAGRWGHTAVWTGSEMIVWGGGAGGNDFNTGGRYNPSTDTWTAIGTTNAPVARFGHTAVWTGTEMIVWGGTDNNGNALNTGARYNPSTDSWTPTSTTGAPSARSTHTAVWTGSEMIVWSGYGGGELNTGGRYNPSTDSWTPTNTTGAPSVRDGNTAVWTGSEMIVWGGDHYDGTNHYLNTGGRYIPGTDSWTATSTSNVPPGRYHHTAVWTGSEMIVWGGTNGSFLNTGGRYNPSSNSWTATSTTGAAIRNLHTAVWAGNQMIVWGGEDGGGGYLNTGGRYCAATPTPTPTATPRATPTPRLNPTPRSRPTPPPRP
jgi:N-acetylneuraminic acid mutarotase